MFEIRAAKLSSKEASSTSESDVFHHLLGEGSPSGSNLTIGALQANSRQVVTGGADTTVSAITYLFYQILCFPSQYKQLQAALDLLPRDASGHLMHEDLAALPLLDAYIYEAMRLQPPIPYQNQRIVPAGGVTVSNVFIPGGTNTRTAIYALSRSSSNFTDPDMFIPERWFSNKYQTENTDNDQDYRFNPKASLPFLTGPYHCVGRNFAMQEMRYSVAALVSRYDMRLANEKEFDRENFENLVQDRSVLEIEGELRAIIKRRET